MNTTLNKEQVKTLTELLNTYNEVAEFLEELRNKTPFYYVIVDSNYDMFYSVKKEGGLAVVSTTNFLHLFTDKDKAEMIAENFGARNGKGPIEWQVLTSGEYAIRALPKIMEMINAIKTALNK